MKKGKVISLSKAKKLPKITIHGIPENLKFPEGSGEVTGYGKEYPIIEKGARQVILDGVDWFRRNMDQHPTKNPKYEMMSDYVSTTGDKTFIEVLDESCQKNYIDAVLLAFCLKHIFAILRHGHKEYFKNLNSKKLSNYKDETTAASKSIHGDSGTADSSIPNNS